ncbi:MAG: hypothetical protein ACI9AR_000210 [Flavobacteriaceae bacterium]|jgi:hypothetical protein
MDALKDLKWLIFIIIAMWGAWAYFGGAERLREEGTAPFITPSEDVSDDGEVYGPGEIAPESERDTSINRTN